MDMKSCWKEILRPRAFLAIPVCAQGSHHRDVPVPSAWSQITTRLSSPPHESSVSPYPTSPLSAQRASELH